MAYRVVRAAEELGLRVPEDLSVIGFDDSPLARRMRPALTTVRQDVGAKGRAAAAALTAAIEASSRGHEAARAPSGCCCRPSWSCATAPRRLAGGADRRTG